MKVKEVLEHYKFNKGESTRLNSIIKMLNGFYGELDARSLTKLHSHEYLKQRGVSSQTIARELNVLSASINFCYKNDILSEKPRSINIEHKTNVRNRWLTKEEIKSLLSTKSLKKNPHILLACKLAVTTAARKEAVLSLMTSQISWSAGRRGIIDYRSGLVNKIPRSVVPVPESMVDELKRACDKSVLGFVVQSRRGRPVKEVQYVYKKAVNEASLGNDVCFHTLRLTCDVNMAQSGKVSMNELSSYLGHTSTKITEKHYAKFFPEYMISSSEVASDLISYV